VKIAVLFDGASALAKSPDLLILETVEAVERSLLAEGNNVVRIPVFTDGRWIERVRRGKFDLVFNVCEGIDGVAHLEPPVIGVLELFGIPYTGSSSHTTSLCLRKHTVNAVLERAGLPIPRWTIVRRNGPLTSVGFPTICKPAAEDASVGVEQPETVMKARAALRRLVGAILVGRHAGGAGDNVRSASSAQSANWLQARRTTRSSAVP